MRDAFPGLRPGILDITCLPGEVMALCFICLPFRDRIAVSHVSRLWRSISLTHPVVWADIELFSSFRNAPELLRMALSRTGTRPVSISALPVHDPGRVIAQCLQEHLHHIQHLLWTLPEYLIPLHIPVPLMEELVCAGNHIDIPNDFLGGHVARLQVLDLTTVSLPPTCPALSTVTTLTLDFPVDTHHAATYGRLFTLCPRLRSLTLHELDPNAEDLLPRGPAPPSLHTLLLTTAHDTYDLIPRVLDWRTDSLHEVRLNQDVLPRSEFANFVEGFTMLHVALKHDLATTQLSARDATSRMHTVRFWRTADDASDVAEMLLHATDALRAIIRIEIPLSMLETFLPVLAALPRLARLGLRVPVGQHIGVAHEVPLELVPSILCVKERCADSLGEIILHVVCPDARCPPTPQEARLLADRVLALGQRGRLPRELVVKGSTCDVFDLTVDFDPVKECEFELTFPCP